MSLERELRNALDHLKAHSRPREDRDSQDYDEREEFNRGMEMMEMAIDKVGDEDGE